MPLLEQFVRNTKLSFVLFSMVLIPLSMLAIFAVQGSQDNYQEYNNIIQVDDAAHLSMLASDVVHHLQIERGASAVFVSSDGRELGAKLAEFRGKTDTIHREFDDLADHLDFENLSPRMRAKFASFEKRIAQLDTMRQKIDTLTVSSAEVIDYFAQMNDDLLGLYFGIVGVSDFKVITQEIIGSVAFQMAKENAGLERAVGASNFAKGVFDTAALVRFSELISVQNSFISQFEDYASQDMLTVLRRYKTSPLVLDVDRMRDVALSAPVGTPIPTISGTDFFDAQTARIDLMQGTVTEINELIMAKIDAQIEVSSRSLTLSIVVSAAMIVVSTLFAIVLLRAFKNVLVKISSRAKEMAEGNLDVKFPKAHNNEIGTLIRSLAYFRDESKQNRDRDRLAAIEKEERAVAIERNAIETRQHSTQVAQELERTATAIEQLNNSVNSVADNMENACRRASQVKAQSETGTETVFRAVKAMEDIKKSSSEIRSITGLIDEISFQTNLLALNARVEAARAGEAGRGFAVVAAEVQQLAARSAKAASDIGQLIEQSSRQVSDGAVIVNKGGEALESIAKEIAEISDTISLASDQTKDQARTIREINQTTNTLDATMQRLIAKGVDTQQSAVLN